MALTLWYSDTARRQIQEYLRGIDDDIVAMAAGEEIRRELSKLLKDPSLGTAPTGPFEDRPIFPFRLSAGDRNRRAQVSYRLNRQANRVEILTFLAVPV